MLTTRTQSRKTTGNNRQFAFRVPPDDAAWLRQARFTTLNVANNHAMDYAEPGYRDTLENLQAAHIAATGQRNQITTLQVKNTHIGIIGFAFSPGFNAIHEIEKAADMVRLAKTKSQYVIVTFHGGAEGSLAARHSNSEETFMNEQRGNTVALSRAVIEAGADIVIGHGPHVLRAAECYQGKPIFYSLGNFVGVGGLSNRALAGASTILDFEISEKGDLLRLGLIPVRINDHKLPQPDPDELGAQLVNFLGENAAFNGRFIQFATDPETRDAFRQWYIRSTKL